MAETSTRRPRSDDRCDRADRPLPTGTAVPPASPGTRSRHPSPTTRLPLFSLPSGGSAHPVKRGRWKACSDVLGGLAAGPPRAVLVPGTGLFHARDMPVLGKRNPDIRQHRSPSKTVAQPLRGAALVRARPCRRAQGRSVGQRRCASTPAAPETEGPATRSTGAGHSRSARATASPLAARYTPAGPRGFS